MSAITEAYGNSGPPFLYTPPDGEKTYRVRLVDDEVKAALEKRQYVRALEILRANKPDLTPAEYAAQLRALNADFQAGEFAFESERGQRYLRGKAGALHLAALLFQCEEMEMMKVMAENAEEVTALLKLAIAESFPKLTKGPSPNGAEKNADGGEDADAQPAPLPDEQKLW